jgi:hypothetical protein
LAWAKEAAVRKGELTTLGLLVSGVRLVDMMAAMGTGVGDRDMVAI